MNKLQKTLFLVSLREQCQEDRQQDWQSLHQRDRDWFLNQPKLNRWSLLQYWVNAFAQAPSHLTHLSPTFIFILGMMLGMGLMSGLVQFQPQQRINLWWWLLLVVWLPTIWWLISLYFTRNSGLWFNAIAHRIPVQWRSAANKTLLGKTAKYLSQHFSLGFGLGMLLTFIAYLALTDMAFGWSSTLDVSSQTVFQLTTVLSLPWAAFVPDAVPSLALIEHTRFFRIDAVQIDHAAMYGQWWSFLLMNLIIYALIPRLITWFLASWGLSRAQNLTFTQDACVDGWWQRLHFEQVEQQVEPAPKNIAPDLDLPTDERTEFRAWPDIQMLVVGGAWPEAQIDEALVQLPVQIRELKILSFEAALSSVASGTKCLLICKGWEPPTGALSDFCVAMSDKNCELFLWPVPLPQMPVKRADQLRASWQLFVPQLPERCHLLEPKSDV